MLYNPVNNSTLALYHTAAQTQQASVYASWCELKEVEQPPTVTTASLFLDYAGMWLCMPNQPRPYQPSDADLLRRAAVGSAGSELAKACGGNLQGQRVLDACAGFGSDGLLLTQFGARVTFVERDRLIWVLLHARVQHLENSTAICDEAFNVLTAAAHPADNWDVVLLDPMFAPSAKKALPDLGLQYLRELTEPAAASADDLSGLVAAAQHRCRGRVVLKRRLKDPLLDRVAFQIKGKSVRFDVYLGTA
ncbi:MAG: class I SAM-dependent methyltransferase [Proteobacteria bacterium]|nr:class I SAM-dependent methyltransferase [Pseudomonadota bacterium]